MSVRERIQFFENMSGTIEKQSASLDWIECRICCMKFSDSITFLSHECETGVTNGSGDSSDSDSDSEHVIKEDLDGIHNCPVCHKKYSNMYILGEHFTREHNTYDDQMVLDHVKPLLGHPGLPLLEDIGMLCVRKSTSDKVCQICDCTDDPDEVCMMCCQNMICKECMESYLIFSDSIMCPFCRHDHTDETVDFIYVMEYDETANGHEDKWIKWWERHLEIFD